MTIEDIYNIEKGVHYTNRPFNDKKAKGFIANYKIVGYVRNTRYLVGLLDKNQGLTSSEIKEGLNCILTINKAEELKRLIYVNIDCLGKYPSEKVILRKSDRLNLEEIKLNIELEK
jgi:hypothetical protein